MHNMQFLQVFPKQNLLSICKHHHLTAFLCIVPCAYTKDTSHFLSIYNINFCAFFCPKIFKMYIVIFWFYLNRQTELLKQANLNILLHDIAQYLGMKYIEIFLQIFWMQVLSSILLRLLITSLLCSLSPTTLMQTTWTPWSSRLTTRMPQRLASCIQRRINPRNTTRKFTNKYQKKT